MTKEEMERKVKWLNENLPHREKNPDEGFFEFLDEEDLKPFDKTCRKTAEEIKLKSINEKEAA